MPPQTQKFKSARMKLNFRTKNFEHASNTPDRQTHKISNIEIFEGAELMLIFTPKFQDAGWNDNHRRSCNLNAKTTSANIVRFKHHEKVMWGFNLLD